MASILGEKGMVPPCYLSTQGSVGPVLGSWFRAGLLGGKAERQARIYQSSHLWRPNQGAVASQVPPSTGATLRELGRQGAAWVAPVGAA